ncbi:serine/threonine protein phosphatase PP2A-associated protein [Epithele typhae]|uniref:serine/threonine protein phosphatase PP2A-associated protein n=1 Tax=Epithele typhae TaxID=378194 RepID=UPI002008B2A2|nr:serine/threonine protein phosphatase PP2A-associated protein [Epithele typhae]KAH9945796.1 serine/threonine protein phosphatase PP2A-associated protein [Epithele typhae]
MSGQNEELSLPSLFHRALTTAAQAVDLPTIQDETQSLIRSAINDLGQCRSRISALSLFSPNEHLSDIPTRDLVYILVPYALSEVLSRVKATGREERLEIANNVKRCLESFVNYLESYEVISEEDKTLYGASAASLIDPAKRRELKIKQFKREKDIKARIETVRRRTNQNVVETSSNLELIASMLPAPSDVSESEDLDSDTEDAMREGLILLLRYLFAESRTQLESTIQEMELLRHAPPEPSQRSLDDPRMGSRREEDNIWRLDPPLNRGGPDGKGPLLDPQGKPLRPFMILPSNAAERARIQAQVFQADHRLPTMTIDEYLAIEQDRGNIISGGGPASEQQPTSKEQLTLDAEQDGTAFGEDKAEEKRLKDESWARYTDANPRGSGNTMNRG